MESSSVDEPELKIYEEPSTELPSVDISGNKRELERSTESTAEDNNQPDKKRTKRDDDANAQPQQPQQSSPQAPTNEIVMIGVEQATFAMGIWCGGSSFSRPARKANVKRLAKKKKTKQKLNIATTNPPLTPEQQAQKESYYLRVIVNVNPFYIKNRIVHKVYAKPEPLKFLIKSKPHDIVFLIPDMKTTKITNRYIATSRIKYHRGNIFDWYIKFADMNTDPKNIFPKTNFGFELEPDQPSLFGMSIGIAKAAQELFQENQVLRWKFKRLAYRWIVSKSRSRQVGADTDLITMEPIPLQEQIRILSTESRTEYVFSGSNLFKSVKSNIECQVGSIAEVKPPKNPYTNVPFSYGQMLEVYHQLAAWCSQKRKPIPTSLCLYRDCNFRPFTLVKLHHNYVSYKAALTYFMEDDTQGDYFVENLENLMDTYYTSLRNYNKELLSPHRFKKWFEINRENFLLRQWKRIIADYWYYEQTSHLAREHWRSDISIIHDIDILIKASENILKNIFKPRAT